MIQFWGRAEKGGGRGPGPETGGRFRERDQDI